MAKKKDTLKELNEFMKSQSPKSTGEDQDYLSQKPTRLAEVDSLKSELRQLNTLPEGALNENEITDFIIKVANAHNITARQVLFRVCEKVISKLESKESTDIIFENMVIYLQHQDLLMEKLKS
jgi:type II secretory pathway component PulM